VFVFVVRSKHVRERGYQTLFNWIMETPAHRNHPIRRLVAAAPGPWTQRAVYMGVHLVFTLVSGAVAVVHWYHPWANVAFLLLVLGQALWNGATFYFDWFAANYRLALRKSLGLVPGAPVSDDDDGSSHTDDSSPKSHQA
jgi:hypothetical protein